MRINTLISGRGLFSFMRRIAPIVKRHSSPAKEVGDIAQLNASDRFCADVAALVATLPEGAIPFQNNPGWLTINQGAAYGVVLVEQDIVFDPPVSAAKEDIKTEIEDLKGRLCELGKKERTAEYAYVNLGEVFGKETIRLDLQRAWRYPHSKSGYEDVFPTSFDRIEYTLRFSPDLFPEDLAVFFRALKEHPELSGLCGYPAHFYADTNEKLSKLNFRVAMRFKGDTPSPGTWEPTGEISLGWRITFNFYSSEAAPAKR